jgi:hypothetical protein
VRFCDKGYQVCIERNTVGYYSRKSDIGYEGILIRICAEFGLVECHKGDLRLKYKIVALHS